MCAENKKMVVEENIDDFDAVSLYPSAMSRMMGLPIGWPYKLTDEDIELIYRGANQFETFFVKVEVMKINKSYRFPL